MDFLARVGMGALGAMLAVSGIADLRHGAWLDGGLQLSLSLYLILESFPRAGKAERERSWLNPALIVVGIVFLLMRTVLRADL